MITLRELVKDRAIGSITTDECKIIAAVLDLAARRWWIRIFMPKLLRREALKMRMLAAVLGRTPAERQPKDVAIRIWREMQADKVAHGK